MLHLASLICGLIFGWGLMISGMVNPTKVLNFLDILAIGTGTWDPSLVVVIGAALLVAGVGYLLAGRSEKPVFAAQHFWAGKKNIDRDLVAGSALFGLGWGLVGLCPGPALANLASLSLQLIVFVIAMAGGMILHNQWERRRGVTGTDLLPQGDG